MKAGLRAAIVALGLIAGAFPASSAVQAAAVKPASTKPAAKAVKAKAVTKISGVAGSQAIIDVTRPASLGNGGADSPTKVSSGRWGGVLLVRADDDFEHMETDWYGHYRFEEETVCPGNGCMDSLATNFVMGGTPGKGPAYAMAPGRYAVVLLGDKGSRVQTTLKMKGLPRGTVAAKATSKAELTSSFQETLGAEGHQAVNRGYSGDDKAGPRFDGLGIAFVGSTPAVANSSQCVTYSTGGGPAPTGAACLQGGGPPGLPPATFVNTGTTLYGFDFFTTSTKSGYVTLGWDAEMVAQESRITVMRFSVLF